MCNTWQIMCYSWYMRMSYILIGPFWNRNRYINSMYLSLESSCPISYVLTSFYLNNAPFILISSNKNGCDFLRFLITLIWWKLLLLLFLFLFFVLFVFVLLFLFCYFCFADLWEAAFDIFVFVFVFCLFIRFICFLSKLCLSNLSH